MARREPIRESGGREAEAEGILSIGTTIFASRLMIFCVFKAIF